MALATDTARRGRTYSGEQLRAIALPLGGLATGQVALGGDGGLRQWQLMNQSNHLAFVPDSFFAIRAGHSPDAETGETRILQSEAVHALPVIDTPLINDDLIPADQRDLVARFGGVAETTFTTAYPFATIDYLDDRLPVNVSLEAYSPYIPLEGDNSELPVISFTFAVTNPGLQPVWGTIAATLKNIVGWDSAAEIRGNACSLFGGNVNTVSVEHGLTSILMENPSLPANHPGLGQLALSTPNQGAFAAPTWSTAGEFIATLQRLDLSTTPPTDHLEPGQKAPIWHLRQRPSRTEERYAAPIPSQPGETWNGGLAVPFNLQPGESDTITILLSWSFPNFYVNYSQPANHFRYELGKSQLWLGNAYGARFQNALAAAHYVVDHEADLEAGSRAWSDAVLGTSVPTWLAEFFAAQGALIRSPTLFRTEDGKLYGFEGTQGASTAFLPWRGYSGSCPLNCTHVWNYEQALSRHFPALERTMRETTLDYVQAPEGYIPHRTLLPLFVKQLWDQSIGGPHNPALDGMLGEVLKTWREIQQGAGEEWATTYWPKVRKLVEYIRATWDPDGDGVLEGEQPNTYDIEFYGTNLFIGSLWLAALRAAEEYARHQGDDAYADELHAQFERGRDNYDRLLWNGEYWIQTLGPDDPVEQQYLTGCLADQLQGQWWAHQLGLGHILPEDHIRTNLQSILKYNMREGFSGYDPEERAFADGDDHGLLIIAWPEGGRPDRPTRYHDEVWTGIEYQVAAHCIQEGLIEEGLRIVEAARNRYDGTKRNPYNDIECGDHYARAMAGWTVLEALAGYRYDALHRAITFRPAVSDETWTGPFLAGTGWGTATIAPNGTGSLTVLRGSVDLAELHLPATFADTKVALNNRPVATSTTNDGVITFVTPVTLTTGDTLMLLSD